jgi:hypothetical protein
MILNSHPKLAVDKITKNEIVGAFRVYEAEECLILGFGGESRRKGKSWEMKS